MNTYNNAPILMFHIGNQPYLYHVLRQAQHASPNNRVVLIGDDTNALSGIEHVRYKDLDNDAIRLFHELFDESFMSRLDYPPLANLRWYYAAYLYYCSYMKSHNVNNAMIMDSDILLYKPVSHIYDFFSTQPGVQANIITGAPMMFLDNLEIRKLCNIIIYLLQNSTVQYFMQRCHSLVLSLVNLNSRITGSIDDTVALSLLAKKNARTTHGVNTVCGNYAIDMNILHEQFKMKGEPNIPTLMNDECSFEFMNNIWRIKYLEIVNGKPYAFSADRSKRYELLASHFSNKAKEYIPEYVTYHDELPMFT